MEVSEEDIELINKRFCERILEIINRKKINDGEKINILKDFCQDYSKKVEKIINKIEKERNKEIKNKYKVKFD